MTSARVAAIGAARQAMKAYKEEGKMTNKPTCLRCGSTVDYGERFCSESCRADSWIESRKEQPGGSTPSQYALPESAQELQDLIEYRDMNFAIGNIFKACYRMGHCDHSDKLRDLRKIKYFVEREIGRVEVLEEGKTC